jgi:F0F1-type ATP synthase membrane subunit b/b'
MIRPILATVENMHEATHEAVQHAATHGGAEHMSFVAYILHSNVINMIFVFCFLIWILKKSDILGVLKNVQEKIKETILKAEEEKAIAQKNLQQAKENVKDLEKQVEKILVEAKSSAESIYEKIQNDAQQKVEEIEKNLNRMIEVEEKSATEEIVTHLSKEAYELATNKIKDALGNELHHKYINNFIDSLDEKKVK